jgi:hypothetical protein
MDALKQAQLKAPQRLQKLKIAVPAMARVAAKIRNETCDRCGTIPNTTARFTIIE